MIETTGVPFLIEQGLEATHARGKLVCIGVPPVGYQMGVDMIKHINVCDLLFSRVIIGF